MKAESCGPQMGVQAALGRGQYPLDIWEVDLGTCVEMQAMEDFWGSLQCSMRSCLSLGNLAVGAICRADVAPSM